MIDTRRVRSSRLLGLALTCPLSLASGSLTAGLLAAGFLATGFSGCSSGGGGYKSQQGGDLAVLATDPANNSRIYLNESVSFRFNREVDIDTASLNSISFDVFDVVTGDPLAEQVAGSFRTGVGEDGATPDAKVVEFLPLFPTNDTYDNGGFRPGRKYVVSMATSAKPNASILRDLNGRPLRTAPNLAFVTPTGRTATELFKNPRLGGPRKVRMDVTPSTLDTHGVPIAPLNLFSQSLVEVRLVFDQALNPSSANIPVNQNQDPIAAAQRRKGRVFMEYDDPQRGQNQWVLATLDLEVNANSGAELVLRPDGVLPNNAEIRVIVEPEVEDIAGESNSQTPGFSRIFGRFRTTESYASQFDAVIDTYADAKLLDPVAPILEPFAKVDNGSLKASFDFEGEDTVVDYAPNTREVILNTDFTQITPSNAPPVNVSGGIFKFRNITIPANVSVRGVGSKPMVWLATGDVRVEGALTVDGGNGARVDTLNSANFITPGGVGNCTGGKGGAGNPITTQSSLRGENGFGANNRPNLGGEGGQMGCGANLPKKGSGGGGGSHTTQGDPLYNDGNTIGTPSVFVQIRGTGGFGANNGQSNLAGGAAGPLQTKDTNPNNNFTGFTVDQFNVRRINGEFATPIGGAGGGGGGNKSSGTPCQAGNPGFVNDPKGGGGGGGGGVLIIKALGRITVGLRGIVSANGGHGGGGEQAGSNADGGGGGGAAGGVVILQSATAIELYAHGGTYSGQAQRDTSFSVSADGGVSLRGDFGGNPIAGKYPVTDAHSRGSDTNSGGFGGMGIVQLMAPPGDNTQDGTNTILDDNVHILDQAGARITGAQKQRYISWVGFVDSNGIARDDSNAQIPNYGGGGDIRPRPYLLPPSFGRMSRSVTRWIWTGASTRRELTAPDGAPRGIVIDTANNLASGPQYFFGGTLPTSTSGEAGFVAYDGSVIRYPVVVSNQEIASRSPLGGTLDGRPVHKVTLAGAPLGDVANRYNNYRLSFKDRLGSVVGELRVLSHDASTLLLEPNDGAIPEAGAVCDLLAKFFDVKTNGAPGLGPIYQSGGRPVPISNIQFGFAFHQNPATPDTNTPNYPRFDNRRFPTKVTDYTYDLESPAAQEALRARHMEYVQISVRFDIDYTDNNPLINPGTNPARPTSPRPELTFTSLPYRF